MLYALCFHLENTNKYLRSIMISKYPTTAGYRLILKKVLYIFACIIKTSLTTTRHLHILETIEKGKYFVDAHFLRWLWDNFLFYSKFKTDVRLRTITQSLGRINLKKNLFSNFDVGTGKVNSCKDLSIDFLMCVNHLRWMHCSWTWNV